MGEQGTVDNTVILLDHENYESVQSNSESQIGKSEVNFEVTSTLNNLEINCVQSENVNLINIEGFTGEPGIIREQTACTPKNGIICPLPKAGFSIPQCSNCEDNINLNCLKNKDKPQYGIGETCCGNNSSCTVKREDEKVTASTEDQILSEETNVKCLDVVCVGHNEGTSNSENDCLTPEAVIEKYLFIMEIIEACFDSLESIKKEPAKVNSSEETTIEMMDDCDGNLINIEGFSGEPGVIREQTACMPKNGIICPLPKTGFSRPQCSNREDNINLNCLKNKGKPQYDIGETCCGNNNNCTENSFVTNRNESLGKREEEEVTASTKDQILSEQINRCLDFVSVRHNEGTSNSENDCLTAEAVIEKYLFIKEIIESCVDSLESIKKERAKLNSSEEITIETTDNCDVKSDESAKPEPLDMADIKEDSVNILQMPEMILEDIIRNLSLDDICNSVRPTCRTFYHASARVLKLVFKSILPKLDDSIKYLENMSFGKNWSRICTGYLTYKLLQSELLTLRAACARQVESGLWCFIPGKTLQEYMRLITGILDEKTTGIIDGISDILVNINKHAIEYFDSLYEAPFSIRDMKLFGVEVIEILSIAMNISASMSVTYSVGGNSCFIVGKFGITHCTELNSPPLTNNSSDGQRKATLMYLRYLVRANNCDIVLRKLREWNKVVKKGSNLPCPYLRWPQWNLLGRYNVVGDYIHDIYKKDAVDEASATDWTCQYSDCNVIMECNFQLICPKFMQPLGVKFQTTSEIINKEEGEHLSTSNGNRPAEVDIEALEHLFQRWEKDQVFCMLKGEEYCFNMSLKLKNPEYAVKAGKPKGQHIKITESYITNNEGKQECGLMIEGNQTIV